MEETISNQFREQQHRDYRLGHQISTKTTEPKPIFEPSDRTMRYILPPRTTQPKPISQQFLYLHRLAR